MPTASTTAPPAAATATAAAAPQTHNSKPPKALLTGSAAPPPSISAPSVPSLARTSLQGVNSGKLSSGTPGGSARIQSQTPYRKGFSKNQVLLKSSNPGWRARGANDNLVISFSDDDESGSDVEERTRVKASACDRPPLVLNSNRRPPALPHVTMKTVSRTAKNEGKVMPQKVSSTRTSMSSMTKIHESNMGISALAEPKSWLKNSNVAGRSLASHDPGCSKNLDPSSSKLEDLRQQIALRENELKLKLVQQNKENVSESCREANAMGQRKVSSRKSKSVPANVQTLTKEPDRKRLRTDASVVTGSCSLSDWNSLPKQTASLMNATSTDPLERSHPGVISENQPSRSAPNQDIHESNKNKVNDHCDATSALKKFNSTSDISLQAHSLQVSNSKFETPDVSPDNSSLLLRLGRAQAFRSGDVDLHSLFELEDLQDKELEEAQEHRRKCEVEERNALNAYRRAQRALLEANARCTYLYRKRELYSAQLRSSLMEDSSLLYSSRQHNETEANWNLSNNISEVNLDLIPSGQHLEELEAGNRLGYNSNVQSLDGDAHNRSSANEDGHNLGSEACSEPDASTSELVRGNNFAINGIRSPSGDLILSPDDDYETFPHVSLDTNVFCPRSKDNTKESEKDMDVDSATFFSKDSSQDPLFLEEYLRSKLISRLGVSSLKRNGIGDNSESSVDRASEGGVAASKGQMIVQCVSLADPNVTAADCRGGPKEPGGSISKALNTQSQRIEEHDLNDSPAPSFNPEECTFLSVDIASTSMILSSPIYRSAMKAARPVILGSLQNLQRKENQYGSPDTCTNNNSLFRHSQDKLSLETTNSVEQLVKCVGFGKIDSYTCKSAIDPFWPLCMYELRGRCNNDECPWQHAKDYSDSDDCQSGWASNYQNPMGQTGFSCVLTPPRYLVCLDTLKDGSHGPHKAHYIGLSGKNIFSHSLVVSSSLIKHLPSDEPCLHGNDGCVESYGGTGHSLYFQSRHGIGNLLRNGLADNDQSLETALIIVSQEVNKMEGMNKALSVLSRALEADPSSLPIWIIYLLLYYSTKYSVGVLSKKSSVPEDDFFFHAVKHIEVSYELWLMYINSRGRLDERFSAYERALSRLCHYASTDHGYWRHKSAAILDLCLQMLYCFCVSGNWAKAVQKIHRLVYSDGDSDESHSLLLSDIVQCLMISDQCIFWVCCVYLVIYRKLPDSLVQQFEFEKDVSLIEWPPVHLTAEEKQHVFRLMEMAIDSVGLNVDSASLENNTLKSTHMLAISHIKLVAAVDGVESCKMLLEKYRNSYSSCLEFILLSARAHDFIAERENFKNFEEILGSWPKNVSGSQCIWNQFAEYALGKGRPDKAKEIMDQWSHSAGVPLLFHNQSVNGENGDSKGTLADPQLGSNMSTLFNISNVDLVFGLLNLSLYKVFQNDVLEAHLAVDKALKVANADMLRHCVKEHAAFLFNNGSQLMKDVSLCGLVDILKGYVIHAQTIPVLEPLTRNFIQDIQKPRTRQLVRNMLSPISPDSLLVNSVLEIWFGSSFLPSNFDQLKDLVDFVEAILEMSPANYQLVLSVCKLVCRDFDSSDSKFSSVLFWASSLLVNTIYHAIPFPPEYVWVEAADLLGKLTSVQEISECFHQRALLVYPFSIKLWQSFLNQSTGASKRSAVIEAAGEKGLVLE